MRHVPTTGAAPAVPAPAAPALPVEQDGRPRDVRFVQFAQNVQWRAAEGGECGWMAEHDGSAPTEVPVGSAREQLGDLVDRAAYGGEATLLTRRGRAVAAIVPVEMLARLHRDAASD